MTQAWTACRSIFLSLGIGLWSVIQWSDPALSQTTYTIPSLNDVLNSGLNRIVDQNALTGSAQPVLEQLMRGPFYVGPTISGEQYQLDSYQQFDRNAARDEKYKTNGEGVFEMVIDALTDPVYDWGEESLREILGATEKGEGGWGDWVASKFVMGFKTAATGEVPLGDRAVEFLVPADATISVLKFSIEFNPALAVGAFLTPSDLADGDVSPAYPPGAQISPRIQVGSAGTDLERGAGAEDEGNHSSTSNDSDHMTINGHDEGPVEPIGIGESDDRE